MVKLPATSLGKRFFFPPVWSVGAVTGSWKFFILGGGEWMYGMVLGTLQVASRQRDGAQTRIVWVRGTWEILYIQYIPFQISREETGSAPQEPPHPPFIKNENTLCSTCGIHQWVGRWAWVFFIRETNSRTRKLPELPSQTPPTFPNGGALYWRVKRQEPYITAICSRIYVQLWAGSRPPARPSTHPNSSFISAFDQDTKLLAILNLQTGEHP